jgi:aminoglycoside phosphotransferase (APT) family kinase protein
MSAPKMHADEIETDVALVRRLLAGQFPQWVDLAIDPVVSYGTDHDIYRLGDHLAARLPRIGWATKQAAKEAEWLPRLAPHLPLAVPVQLAMGHPAEGYPLRLVGVRVVAGRERQRHDRRSGPSGSRPCRVRECAAPGRRNRCTSASSG